jgi:hypothetical protein
LLEAEDSAEPSNFLSEAYQIQSCTIQGFLSYL